MKACFALLALTLFHYLSAQVPDTIYQNGKVILRSNILTTIDGAEWRKRKVDNKDVVPDELATQKQFSTCGVTASFTPGGDSTFSVAFSTVFTSTSTNATSQQWIVNGITLSSQPSFSYSFFPVGLHEIKLVAKNGGCTDTATAYYLYTGVDAVSPRKTLLNNYGLHLTEEFATAMDNVPGGFLLAGYSTGWKDQLGDRGLLVKIKESGCIEWSKLFDGEYRGKLSMVRSLRDSGFIVISAGYLKTTVMRFNKTAQIVWKRSYRFGTQPVYFGQVLEDADGSLCIAGTPGVGELNVARLTASGDIVWCKNYSKSTNMFISANGMTQIGNRIFVSGYIDNPNQEVPFNSEYNKDGFIVSIDKTTATTVWSKMFGAVGVSDFFQDIHAYGDNLLTNDIRTNYLGSGSARQAIHFIDTSGTVLKSRVMVPTAPLSFPFMCNIIPLSNKKLYLTQGSYELMNLQPGYTYRSYWQRIDTSGTIYWQAGAGSISRPKFWYSSLGENGKLASLGEQPISLVRVYNSSSNFLFALIDSTGPVEPNSCTFYSTNHTIANDQILGFPISWIRDTSITLQWTDPVTIPATTYAEMRFQCPDYIDSCNYIKLKGETKLCKLNQTYIYYASKTSGCTTPVEWQYSSGVQMVSSTATSITVQFNSFGQHKLYSYLRNICSPAMDSLTVTIAPSSAFLNLGPDTSLCTGNSIKLSAGVKFLSYKWNDNSTDSSLVVSIPGKYWVTVSDTCGNILSDTVYVTNAASAPISIGPDRTKCNADTLRLSAPAGFLNYTWSNSYNISSTTSQNVIVNPLIDTSYYIKAEKTPGCFAYDTVRITVHHSPPIDLGNDKSFCLGDSAVFDAGAGFQTYAWSGGQSNQRIDVKTAGTYSVVGTTAEGCKSADTAKVLNVYSLPSVSLDKKTAICSGDSKTLNAGNFASYSWSTSQNTAAIVVNAIGRYTVIVTDANGCKGSDATAITTINVLPAGFLPLDTAVCSYGSVQLKPLASFSRYLWSTGDLNAFITVSKPGLYWLEVVDGNTCKGRDTITVNPKDCMKGFYAPAAFTPNGDGKNDAFYPLPFGKVKAYHFTVYNRWGQAIFKTNELQKGWDGKVAGTLQRSDVFVWICTYQFEGEAAKTEKGTITLIR